MKFERLIAFALLVVTAVMWTTASSSAAEFRLTDLATQAWGAIQNSDSKPIRAYKPGDTFKDCDICPEMVVVPAGEFSVGSPASEEGRYKDEGPQRKVTIAEPFAVGKFEVTFAEWDACVAEDGCNGYRPDDRGWGRGKRPVIDVSWPDAKSYLAWLSRRTGKNYRLLSEAEWEYAARAGTATPFSNSQSITTKEANYNGNFTYGGSAEGDYREQTVEVGSFRPNAFGLHDIHGNVWEWVEDCWNGNYTGSPTDGSAWTVGICSLHVFRGGSWKDKPRDLRSAVRGGDFTEYSDFSFGFRLARAVN